MRIIAITGGIGSGKTTVAGWIGETGVPVIDADRISRELTAAGGEALPDIRAAFGEGVFAEDGTLNRAALAARIFGGDSAALETLNRILHPRILRRMQAQLAALSARKTPLCVIDVPLLYEAGMETMADAVLCVTASLETRIRRLTQRSGLTPEQALQRIQAQQDTGETRRLADYVLSTDADTQINRGNALALWRRILQENKE